MTLALLALVLGLVVAAMPRWSAPLARRTGPDERLWLGVAALGLGALLVEIALILLAVPAVMSAAGNDALAARCRSLLADVTPGGAWLSWTAAALALLFPVLARRGWRRAAQVTQRMRAEPALGVHHEVDGIDLVRLPTDQPLAYSIEGACPQIVVSDGLIRMLSAAELDVVIAHERAHVHWRHGRILRGLTVIETAAPPSRVVTRRVRIALERCADERAAGDDPARRAVLVDALLKLSGATAPLPIAAISSASGVVERVDALLGGSPPPSTLSRVATRSMFGAAALGSVALLGAWAVEAHVLLTIASRCS
jgi:beta-lactamase regulating signal transducer with metallopeptidase domain